MVLTPTILQPFFLCWFFKIYKIQGKGLNGDRIINNMDGDTGGHEDINNTPPEMSSTPAKETESERVPDGNDADFEPDESFDMPDNPLVKVFIVFK